MDVSSVWIVAVVALILLILSIFAFRVYSRETVFEQAYGVNALRLFAEDRSTKTKNGKNRSKPKTVAEKRKDVQSSKKDVVEKSDIQVAVSNQTPDSNIANTQKLNDIKPVNVTPVKTGKKKPNSEKSSSPELNGLEAENLDKTAEKPVETKREIMEIEITKKNHPMLNSANGHQKHTGDKDKQNSQLKTKSIQAASASSDAKVEREKTNPVKEVPFSEMKIRNDNTVIPNDAELRAIMEKCKQEASAEKHAYEVKLDSLKQQLVDKTAAVTQLMNDLKNSNKKDAEISRLRDNVVDAKKKYETLEEVMRTQVNTNSQTRLQHESSRHELEQKLAECKKELKKKQEELSVRPSDKQIAENQQKIGQLTSELASAKNLISRLQTENRQHASAVQEAKNNLQNREHDVDGLSKANSLLEQRLLSIAEKENVEREMVENKLKTVKNTVEQLDVTVCNVRRELVQRQENEKLTNEKEKLLTEKEVEISTLRNENACLIKQIEKINVEIGSLWCCRDELNEFRKIYEAKIKYINTLEKDLAQVKSDFDKSSKQNAAILQDAKNNMNTEFVKKDVKKTADADLANEVISLKKEIEYLRETNYKMVDLSQNQEKIFKQALHKMMKDKTGISSVPCKNSGSLEALAHKYREMLLNFAQLINTIEQKLWDQESAHEAQIRDLKILIDQKTH